MLFILNGFEDDTTAVNITGPFGSFDCVQKGGGAFQCQVPLSRWTPCAMNAAPILL